MLRRCLPTDLQADSGARARLVRIVSSWSPPARSQAADPPHDRRRRVGSPLAAIRQGMAILDGTPRRRDVGTGAMLAVIVTDLATATAWPRSGR
jgi:hypothetical protein